MVRYCTSYSAIQALGINIYYLLNVRRRLSLVSNLEHILSKTQPEADNCAAYTMAFQHDAGERGRFPPDCYHHSQEQVSHKVPQPLHQGGRKPFMRRCTK